MLYQFIQLFTRSHFSHMFSLYSHGTLGVVCTGAVLGDTTKFSRPASMQRNTRGSCFVYLPGSAELKISLAII